MPPFPNNDYTAEEIATARAMRLRGSSFAEIAAALGRDSARGVHHRLNKQNAADAEAARLAEVNRRARDRACMRCRTVFRSPHCGVRRCDTCRGVSDSPFEPNGITGLHDDSLPRLIGSKFGVGV